MKKERSLQVLCFAAIWGTRAALLLGTLAMLYRGDFYNALAGVAGIAITFIPAILPEKWRDRLLPKHADVLVSLYVFCAIFMAMHLDIYTLIPQWDKFLHILCGICFALLGLHICSGLAKDSSLPLLLLFGFCFALAVGCVWEIYEFTLDRLVDSNAQHWKDGDNAGLYDTMYDMIANTLGALITLVIYTWRWKRQRKTLQ